MPRKKSGVGSIEEQCIYCGRWMDDPTATRRAVYDDHVYLSCVLCDSVVGIARAKSLRGRQRFISETLNIKRLSRDSPTRVYVNREGKQSVKPRVDIRKDLWDRYGNKV